MSKRTVFLTGLFFLGVLSSVSGQKASLTLDDFFESVEIRSVQISPSGHEVVIETVSRDWAASHYRNDLWIYRDAGGGSLVPIPQSGSAPQWSPDGRWIAFLSEQDAAGGGSKNPKDEEKQASGNAGARVYVVSADGGTALAVTSGEQEIHSFAWSADSRQIYFATRDPWTKAEEEAYQKEWKDIVRFRESERGDAIYAVESVTSDRKKSAGSYSKAKIAAVQNRVDQMAASPNGHALAFVTSSRSGRVESPEPYGIYVLDPVGGGTPHLVLHTLGPVEPWAAATDAWSTDGQQIFFLYSFGAPEGPFQTTQTRLYALSLNGSKPKRWASEFPGHIDSYALTHDETVICAARLGTEIRPYLASANHRQLAEKSGWSGTYRDVSAARSSPRLAFMFSSLQQPPEVYLADSADNLREARPVTSFNKLFTERELPRGRVYRWKADDNVEVEGMLIYPPRQYEGKHLPMLTLMHGGPTSADGNRFEPDWDRWAALAATQGWLVFQPNYRGSVGYGDTFTLGLIPQAASRAGGDILQGIDSLVKDGIADPERLTIGGYSFGGYLTNWLITQTTRFKAAVTGAGDVELVAGWGNNDGPFMFAYSLGGVPWEAESNYNAQAPIWQIGKVTTPTHIVTGAEDFRVFFGEAFLLERALTARGIPNRLLIFPGEGHELDKNPWHGKIKVREELKWLEEYGKSSRQTR
jgi:dipeptidyl aminopeptidase/acylaminoacyl peptidase